MKTSLCSELLENAFCFAQPFSRWFDAYIFSTRLILRWYLVQGTRGTRYLVPCTGTISPSTERRQAPDCHKLSTGTWYRRLQGTRYYSDLTRIPTHHTGNVNEIWNMENVHDVHSFVHDLSLVRWIQISLLPVSTYIQDNAHPPPLNFFTQYSVTADYVCTQHHDSFLLRSAHDPRK